MKIYGELKRSQLEQLTADPTGLVSRIYSNVLTPTAARPKFYNGTAWKSLAYTDEILAPTGVYYNAGLISTATATINWANGTRQRITVAANAVVSFSNWQEGYDHTLVLENTSVNYYDSRKVVFNLAEQYCVDNFHPLPIAPNDRQVITWHYNSSFNKAWENIAITAGMVPAIQPFNIEFDPKSKNMIFCSPTSPHWETRSFNGTSNMYGFSNGARLITNVAKVGSALDSAIACDGTYHALVSSAAPFQGAAPISMGYGGTIYVTPTTAPTGVGYAIATHPWMPHFYVVGHATTPFITAYQKNFATPVVAATPGFVKMTNPATLPAGTIVGLAFHPIKSILYAIEQATGLIKCYAFTFLGFGTVTDVSTGLTMTAAGTGAGKRIAVSPKGDYIAVISSTSVVVYPLDASGIPVVASAITPSVAPPAACYSVKWDHTGRFLYLTCSAATDNAMIYYDFGTNNNLTLGYYSLSNMSNATAGTGFGIHPSNLFMAWAVNIVSGPYYTGMFNSASTTAPTFKYFRTYYSHA